MQQGFLMFSGGIDKQHQAVRSIKVFKAGKRKPQKKIQKKILFKILFFSKKLQNKTLTQLRKCNIQQGFLMFSGVIDKQYWVVKIIKVFKDGKSKTTEKNTEENSIQNPLFSKKLQIKPWVN